MTLSQALAQFWSDGYLKAALILILVDFVLGVAAALKTGAFRLSYIADFARNDLAFKLGPWLALYIGAALAPNSSLGGTGIDLGTAAGAAYAAIVLAWTGSILNSLTELGLPTGALHLRRALAGSENEPLGPEAPPPPPAK